jgi:beta-phosphoglucomutase-like phosphatase (HAD superfamily)
MGLPRRPLAVVFDLDGTLIDSETLVRDAFFAACEEFDVAMSEAQFLSLVGRHRDANDAALLGFYGADFRSSASVRGRLRISASGSRRSNQAPWN